MTYPEATKYLKSFIDYEQQDCYDYNKSFSLDRMRRLVQYLGNPHQDIPSIHVAGTKGKGSTAVFIHSILKNAGLKAGLYTSPHLASFRERIRIGDILISEKDICRLVDRIKPAVRKIGPERPSFFEIYTSLAFLYFGEKKIDAAVYEVGMGGRLDATNVITPLVSVIAPISYDHVDKLGTRLEEIAAEKAGIIKEGVVCVSAPQERKADEVIKKVSKDKRTRLITVGRDIHIRRLDSTDSKEIFSVKGVFSEYKYLETKLLGQHQVENAALAIGAIEALRGCGIYIGEDAVQRGVRDAAWPGRLEVIRRRPFVVLDGAQNRASANALKKALEGRFKHERLILVLGISKDKDIEGVVRELSPLADSIVLTKSNIPERASEPSCISKFLGPKSDVVSTRNVEEALVEAFSKAAPEDLILITGSLFVVGEARELILKKG